MSDADSICTSEEKLPVEYRDIPGFPGYRVGSDGSVWSRKVGDCWRKMNLTRRSRQWAARVCKDSRKYSMCVARLVLTAFVRQPAPNEDALHFPDRDISNNCVQNLRWGTQAENYADSVIHGTNAKGSKHGKSVFTEGDVLEIDSCLKKGERIASLARRFKVSDTTIGDIKIGRTWSHITGRKKLVPQGRKSGKQK